nr:PREDICTED: uncharacterized protein LOC109042453 [Bemisia tabaci]XP_018914741.1 PREDICTED: uncharacterized protein LOC109042453 [Bemisia tabaci]XP_018914742.1 PREDICTED: uncharacterized protein LOC109042453 [Bemisia tabaci]
MDVEIPNTSNGAEEEVILSQAVEELSQEYGESTFCEKCPFDQHYFPYRCVPLSNLEGHLRIADYPFFGFILQTEDTDYFLILQNRMNIIASFLMGVNNKVRIKNGLWITEHYQALNKRFYPETFQLEFLEVAENIDIVEENDVISTICSTSPGNSAAVNKISDEYRSQAFLVLHVSNVLSIGDITVCLLFIKLLESTSEDVWLILQNKTCSWSVTLLPGYKYELLIPNSFPKDILSKHKQSLKEILPLQFHGSFETIFHHPELFSTMNACYVPGGSKLKVLPPSVTSLTLNALSVREASSENADLISMYGRVTKVNHIMRQWSQCCPMCSKASAEDSDDIPLQSSQKPGLNINSFRAEPKIPSEGIILSESETLPVKNDRRTFGVLGSLVKKLTVRGLQGDSETIVFLRDHSFYTGFEKVDFRSGLLHDGGILPNTIVCFESLVKKTPLKGKPYFLTTPLTKIFILGRVLDDAEIEVSWSSYGPPIKIDEWTQGKVFWFALDFPDLVYVKITAICDTCEGQLNDNLCPSFCQTLSSKIDATAILMVDHVTMPPFKLIMKNSHVKTFLGADDTMWDWFHTAARRSPLIYRRESLEEMDHSVEGEFPALFKFYCDLFRPKKMWHVCVKIMPQKSEDAKNNLFTVFCLEMLPVDPARTAKFAYNLEALENSN